MLEIVVRKAYQIIILDEKDHTFNQMSEKTHDNWIHMFLS